MMVTSTKILKRCDHDASLTNNDGRSMWWTIHLRESHFSPSSSMTHFPPIVYKKISAPTTPPQPLTTSEGQTPLTTPLNPATSTWTIQPIHFSTTLGVVTTSSRTTNEVVDSLIAYMDQIERGLYIMSSLSPSRWSWAGKSRPQL